jgi:transposase
MNAHPQDERQATAPAAAGNQTGNDGGEWPTELKEAAVDAHKRTEEAKMKLAAAQEAARKADEEIRHFSGIEKALIHREKAMASPPAPAPPPSAQKRKKHQEVSGQVRALIAEAILDKDMTYDDAEKHFDVSRATVWRIVKEERAARSGEAPPPKVQQKRGRRTAFTPDSLVWLCVEIERDAGVTLKDLANGLLEKFDIDVGVAAISKTIKSLDITWKMTCEIPEVWNAAPTIEKRIGFVNRIREELLEERDLIYIDEQGYDLKQARKSKGHALAGRPAVLTMKPKGRRISVIAALGKSGIMHTKLVDSLGPAKRGTTGDDFRLFIHDARPLLRGKVILLDTARIHDTKELDALWPELKAHDNIDVVFLPPYSSFLSAIEYAFNKMKMIVINLKPANHAELKDAINRAGKEITPHDAEGFFHKAHSYWKQAALGIPFQGKILDPELAVLAPAAVQTASQAKA